MKTLLIGYLQGASITFILCWTAEIYTGRSNVKMRTIAALTWPYAWFKLVFGRH